MTCNNALHIFERPLVPGYIYRCAVEDLRQRLLDIPAADLEGLWAVGLVSSTRHDRSANGRYFFCEKPVIHILSYPATFGYRLAPHFKYSDIALYLAVELRFGMRVEKTGSRWSCSWDKEDLRRFTLEHVLLHEIGHHVDRQQRRKAGMRSLPGYHVREQFAEAYALRHERESVIFA